MKSNDHLKKLNPEKESAMRLLRRLRILLIILLLSFIATIVWLSMAPGS